jgi:Protein of unknown function (DUF1573)
MSSRKRRSALQAAPLAPRTQATASRRRRSRKTSPMVWLAGIAIVVVVLMGLSLSQSGALAKPEPPSRTEDVANLLPLAQAVRPLTGGHDMARIPAQTPVPQAAPEGVAAPVLQMPSAKYDWGIIPKAPPVTHIFAVQNTGTADLVLSNMVTSCGCTTSQLSSSVIPPGQRADLTITFNPSFHKVEGDVTRLVWFGTNDPTQPWVEVKLTANVQP